MGLNVRILQVDTLAGMREEVARLGADPVVLESMAAKGVNCVVKAEGLTAFEAAIVKQQMLSAGGDCAVSGPAYRGEGTTDVLLLGSLAMLHSVIPTLCDQPLDRLRNLANELDINLRRWKEHPPPLTIAGRTFEWGRQTYVMGIINVTPDSFSGDGRLDVEAAVALGRQMVADGAHMLDVGGESTRPGSEPVPADEEKRRVLPVIARLAAEVDVPISIDTYKAEVAAAALDAGAHIVNDVWALQADPDMAALVAERQVPAILMHNRSRPKDVLWRGELGGMYKGAEYQDLLGEVLAELEARIRVAEEAGIPRQRLIVDPGIGFGKSVEHNLELVNRIGELRVLGCPILVGPSRKSFIGYTLNLPPHERVEGTAASVAIAISRGVDIVRVHDVKEMVRVARMTDALTRRGG